MRIKDLLPTLDPDTLVWIAEEDREYPDQPNGLFCCPVGQLTVKDLKPYRDRPVCLIYPEKYGKYYGRTGISIIISRH